MASLPPSLKSLQHYMKIAAEHDKRNLVVAYYSRMYVAQQGIKIDSKSQEARKFLMGLMDSLDAMKKVNASVNEAFKDDIVAQAVIEEYTLKLFSYADIEDRAERFNKNVIKAFYTAGMLMDVLTQFSELSEEILHKRKYSKWKAAHINACLKNGEKPHPGPLNFEDEDENGATGETSVVPIGFSVPPIDQSSIIDQKSYLNNELNAPNSHPASPSTFDSNPNPSSSSPTLSPIDIKEAQKLMKFASSALNFDDVPTAVDNLEKALKLLKAGQQ